MPTPSQRRPAEVGDVKKVRTSQRREMARRAVEGGRTDIRHACQTFEVSEACYLPSLGERGKRSEASARKAITGSMDLPASPSAIHDDIRAVDERGRRGGEKERRPPDLVTCADPPHRDLCCECLNKSRTSGLHSQRREWAR